MGKTVFFKDTKEQERAIDAILATRDKLYAHIKSGAGWIFASDQSQFSPQMLLEELAYICNILYKDDEKGLKEHLQLENLEGEVLERPQHLQLTKIVF